MKPRTTYLIISISCLLICVALSWYGCKETHETGSWCVPESIYCAWVAGKDYPVRIAVQHIKPGVDHCQADAKIDGVWTPLTPKWGGTGIKVVKYRRHFDTEM